MLQKQSDEVDRVKVDGRGSCGRRFACESRYVGSAQWFEWFAANEARGASPSYEALATQAATDVELCHRLDELPPGLQQPNLLFSAVRLLGGPTDDWSRFRPFVDERWLDVSDVLHRRTVQTNEVARCGALLPILAGVSQPIALIEVGASAGLCLFPDRYQYSYNGSIVGPASPVRIDVQCVGPVPIPERLPEVVWRAGLDLRPLDVTNEDDVAWLRACLWPEHQERRKRLDAAISVARHDPPSITSGDLASDLVALLEAAPSDATTVVFHSAVLVYCSPEQRREFVDVVTSRPDVVWVSNEAPGVVPGLETDQPLPSMAANKVGFVVAVGGREAVARADGHGSWLAWA